MWERKLCWSWLGAPSGTPPPPAPSPLETLGSCERQNLPPPKAKYLQLGTAQRGRPPDVPEPVNMLRAIAVLTSEKEGDSDGR